MTHEFEQEELFLQALFGRMNSQVREFYTELNALKRELTEEEEDFLDALETSPLFQ